MLHLPKLTKSNTCRAKNRAFCRYHGVKAPFTLDTLRDRAAQAQKELKKELDHPLPDTTLRHTYQNTIRDSLIEEAIIIANNKNSKVNLEELTEKLGAPVDEELVKSVANMRKIYIKGYAKELRETLFDNDVERLIAEKGLPEDAAYNQLKEHDFPRTVEVPISAKNNYIKTDVWEIYKNNYQVTPHEHQEYRMAEQYAYENNMELIPVKNPKNNKIIIVPFSYTKYGVTKTQVNTLLKNRKFMKKLQQYHMAVNYVKAGNSPTVLAGGREDKPEK